MGWLNTFSHYVSLPAIVSSCCHARRSTAGALGLCSHQQVVLYTCVRTVLCGQYSCCGRRRLLRPTVSGAVRALNGNQSVTWGLAIAHSGLPRTGGGAVALIFCFEKHHAFYQSQHDDMAWPVVPPVRPGALVLEVVRKIAFHPFILATCRLVFGAAGWICSALPLAA